MLLSRARKFLFVHIQKTGGSSLRAALTAAIPDLVPFLGTHDPVRLARPLLAEEWSDYLKVAFVRNPWDRLVSWYAMIRQQGDYSNRFWEYVRSRASNFEEFLTLCTDVIEDHDGAKSIVFNQLDYVTDEKGKMLVDFIGRYESLEQDAANLFRRLGIDARLPHVNRSRHEHYSAWYSERTRELVANRHRRDIQTFGYQFEEDSRSTGPASERSNR